MQEHLQAEASYPRVKQTVLTCRAITNFLPSNQTLDTFDRQLMSVVCHFHKMDSK